jgi:hypothetical protein
MKTRTPLLKRQAARGSILVTAIVTITLGSFVIASLLGYAGRNSLMVEKELGHTKSFQALKLAMRLFNTTIAQNPEMADPELEELQRRIGGGATSAQSIFGYTSSDTASRIPGFNQFTITWRLPRAVISQPNMVPPTDNNAGFWYFPGTFDTDVVARHTDAVNGSVPAVRENSIATLTTSGQTQVIPVFNMLAFYDTDWEISAHYESAQLIGRIHTNGSVFLDCRSSGPDRIRFHGLRGSPVITAKNHVYRRGRNGATSYYKFGTTAQRGLDFFVYSSTDFSSIISSTNYNYYNQSGSAYWERDLIPPYTNFEDGSSPGTDGDSAAEEIARTFGGHGADFGYVYTGTNSYDSTTFECDDSNGDLYPVVRKGDGADENLDLQPPVTIQPYQYVEDLQYADTPDTVDYGPPHSSNYSEDAAKDNRLAQIALNSQAALYIRDGVAYYRTQPGGDLTPVINLIDGVTGDDDPLYPHRDHPDAAYYGDLRWFGWFGMYDGVSPSPDNPARWHFPIRSVTYNKTKDADNVPSDGTTSTEGTAVPFTFRSATVHNPLYDGYKKKTDSNLADSAAPWIKRNQDLDDLSDSYYGNYPGLNTNTPTGGHASSDNGAGIGMWNVDYPTIDGDNKEQYDPARVAYNIVKANVRRLHNAVHLYTSRHDGTEMKDWNGDAPSAMDGCPNVWGAAVDASSFGAVAPVGPPDYDNADGDNDENTGKDYSAFWNDDGATQPPGQGPMTAVHTIASVPNAHGTWTTVDLGAPVTCRFFRVDMPANSFGNFCEVQVSEDNMTWYHGSSGNVANFEGTPGTWGGGHTFDQASDGDIAAANYFDAPDSNPCYFQIEFNADLNIRYIRYMPRDTFQNRPDGSTFSLAPYVAGGGTKLYTYHRVGENVLNGVLQADGANDDTPKVELFPIRHKSLCNPGAPPDSVDDWFIYKSTLPLADRTLPMPTSRDNLYGYDFVAGTTIAADTTTNFGCNTNWFVIQNNAPEMLAKQAAATISFETTFSYYAGDCGGYYGNDNLCMIDVQEKKVVVFTEIDMAEFTKECLMFNRLDTVLDSNVFSDVFTQFNPITSASAALQNIVYVANTTMGKNFYGKRVHCGAVRIKRGRLLPFRMSIVSPNMVHVWGDFNCPGYWHHGKGNGNTSVSYNVPVSREHDASTVIPVFPAAVYADAVSAYENSWIPFDLSNGSTGDDDITQTGYGTLRTTINNRTNENISFDHKLWWEDDGMRREGNGSSAAGNGAQMFLNYHEMVFDHIDNDYFAENSAWGARGSSHQIWKHIPQGVNAGLFYGNVPSRLPSFFTQADINAVDAILSRPASVSQLDWYMSWIGRDQWVECERDWMREDLANTVCNGGFDPSTVDGSWMSTTLSPSSYLGTDFPDSAPNTNGTAANIEWENCKLKFSGGGFLYDIRFHTNHTHNLDEWSSGAQTFGRNIVGSFACLFSSRQNPHGYNDTLLGAECQQIFYNYNPMFNNSDNLPPGTPLTNVIPETRWTIRGTKWQY